MKRVRPYNAEKFSQENYVETKNWTLHPDDRKTANMLYETYLENKDKLKSK